MYVIDVSINVCEGRQKNIRTANLAVAGINAGRLIIAKKKKGQFE